MKIVKANSVVDGTSGWVSHLTYEEAIILKKILSSVGPGVSSSAFNPIVDMHCGMTDAGVQNCGGQIFYEAPKPSPSFLSLVDNAMNGW